MNYIVKCLDLIRKFAELPDHFVTCSGMQICRHRVVFFLIFTANQGSFLSEWVFNACNGAKNKSCFCSNFWNWCGTKVGAKNGLLFLTAYMLAPQPSLPCHSEKLKIWNLKEQCLVNAHNKFEAVCCYKTKVMNFFPIFFWWCCLFPEQD